tara:strand:- start:222 stop:452 length:231 start_codon:yes stop_codon:yes gene_type:complete
MDEKRIKNTRIVKKQIKIINDIRKIVIPTHENILKNWSIITIENLKNILYIMNTILQDMETRLIEEEMIRLKEIDT